MAIDTGKYLVHARINVESDIGPLHVAIALNVNALIGAGLGKDVCKGMFKITIFLKGMIMKINKITRPLAYFALLFASVFLAGCQTWGWVETVDRKVEQIDKRNKGYEESVGICKVYDKNGSLKACLHNPRDFCNSLSSGKDIERVAWEANGSCYR
ncbi:hypothetical protein BK026_01835 [Alteromonas sp. V450]|uniref:hypothetical protein n=1 Tax=Alteromonas sp. V450 TaxID=1912139 RepID=UPI0008FF2670|nr:hypothetical protein [Alteromonas sp. V450]OJF67626.1 hypothetical protein BK026_01835 [Alteromonas sp. V450]